MCVLARYRVVFLPSNAEAQNAEAQIEYSIFFPFMPEAKINVFCPIETINRELDFRLFFAAVAVRPDIRFIIGKHFTIFKLLQEIGGGIYLGQNVRPQRDNANMDERVHRLRASGTTLVVLDEEGGVMTGDEARWKNWLDYRVDPTQLQAHEHLCTWGNWQRDYYRSLNVPNASHIQATGHPRFDLYKPRFRGYYDALTAALRERYGDFVLVNTNFAWANHFMGEKYVFSENSYYDANDAQKRLDFVRHWSHTTQVRAKMVALITRLSMEMPHVNFVVRPHPSENMQSYRTLFHDSPNVIVNHEGSVGAWILASRALIHDGCTTALEAHFCDVPILNYKSVDDARYDLMLPNALGERYESEDRVLDALHAILNGDSSRGVTRDLPPIAKSLIHNFEHDAFAELTHYLYRVVENVAPSKSESERVLRHHGRIEKIRPIARQLKTKLRPRQNKMVEKFYGFAPHDLHERFARVQQIVDKDLRFRLLSNLVLTVEC